MSEAESDPRQVPLSAYPYRMDIPTRFGDNDMLGHANNVAYNRYIEAVVTQFQMQEAGVDYARHRIAPVAVEVLCRFHRSLSYPETVHAGLRVGRLGNSSVTFLIGLFGAADREAPAATGHFIHVYSDRDAEISVPMPDAARAVYERFR
ncbi:thioesterase family protein [Thalassospiraceae bacterium LMO-SO8]|nr:acyl-CoA thioesterase [Alphaproteobacteria bacterium LMO-S08]WND75087.1 thioesterase family protein [Thalassospiraceae bacterium LMO-SO8]